MGKGHRDNHAARLNRGKAAFAKKAERREPDSKCNLCGRACRAHKLVGGLCPVCFPGGGAARNPEGP
jgi:hypothetical protein